MLDVFYPSIAAFRAACAEAAAFIPGQASEYDADRLLQSGDYAIMEDGTVRAADWAWDHVGEQQ